MTLRHKKGQSTLEYVLLVTAVIVVAISFLMGKDSTFQKALTNSLGSGTAGMQSMAAKIVRNTN